MSKQEMLRRIEELERRVRDLERQTLFVPVVPAPSPSLPQWVPAPWQPPYIITC